MQAIRSQDTQKIRALEESLEEKKEKLKESHQQVSYDLEHNDFVSSIGQLLQLYKMEDDLQAKDKQIALLEARLEGKQTQLPSVQAEKQSNDAATQFICSDVAECKSPFLFIPFLVLALIIFLAWTRW